MTSGALARVIRSAADRRTDAERCDLCGADVPSDHRHLLDTGDEEVLCACRPCSLLFVKEAASEGRYRLVPLRRVRLPPVGTRGLGVPVGLAFFVRHADGTVSAHYPSPAGAMRWEADPEAWREVVAACPPLAGLEPDVEALLVNTARSADHHWIAPIDDCFRMVALVRTLWRGLSGGSQVWPAIDRFFAELTEQP
ncbi:DUF5947 family protein [Streptomyces sp. SID2888]|uniref:DUF5947 family protein n=1 Tax=Streptomyces sp. SID2888 TaxID=2690256 RepID=UPI00136DFAE7|nr:DUF5947 family protein [Streptomyces sp. SID2888]MYV47301.1 hypothetical protein [Streptomyces sp. SID2888]